VLIIADIVQTITIDPTLESALTLVVIVFVRTFLIVSLEIELDGVVPWRRTASNREPGFPDRSPSVRSPRSFTPARVMQRGAEIDSIDMPAEKSFPAVRGGSEVTARW
jgi:Protein of unknown function (DUF1622)